MFLTTWFALVGILLFVLSNAATAGYAYKAGLDEGRLQEKADHKRQR